MAARPEQALDSVNLARRLDPHNEYYYRFLQGLTEFSREKYEEAITSFELAFELNPELWSAGDGYGCAPTPVQPLLSAYHYLGKKEAITNLLQDTKFRCPVNSAMLSWPFKESRDHDRLSDGLKGAGVPAIHPL